MPLQLAILPSTVRILVEKHEDKTVNRPVRPV
jgi:hypothetical protein